MKKSLIALAVAAALPVVVQADVTLSGSVTAKISDSSTIDTDASLKVAVQEQLANGMTAKADFEVMAQDGNRGTASLAGDFGSLTAGTIDSDAAFQSGDVAELVDNTVDVDGLDTEVQGLHVATNLGGLQMQLQRNAATGADATTLVNVASTQVGLVYKLNGLPILNGLSISAAHASADADIIYPVAVADTAGLNEEVTAYGFSYSFGDMTFQAGKQEGKKTQSKVSYVAAMNAISWEASVLGGTTQSHKLIGTFTVSNSLSVTATSEKGKKIKYGATYTSGDLTLDASVDSNDKDKMSAALDMGNADLTLAIEDDNQTKKTTSLTYKVAF
jgi:hypothetical protein